MSFINIGSIVYLKSLTVEGLAMLICVFHRCTTYLGMETHQTTVILLHSYPEKVLLNISHHFYPSSLYKIIVCSYE
jgi:hypothetical protein